MPVILRTARGWYVLIDDGDPRAIGPFVTRDEVRAVLLSLGGRAIT